MSLDRVTRRELLHGALAASGALAAAAGSAGAAPGAAPAAKAQAGESDRGRRVRVAALSAGPEHFRAGNPGPDANLGRLVQLAEASIEHRPDIICFPEFATTGWPYPPAARVRATGEPVPGDGPTYRRYQELARRSGAVVCGWVAEKESERIFHNTSFLVRPDGEFVGRYRKVHPTPGEEGEWGMAPGEEIPVFDLGFAKVGLAICFDMHFPEVCRTLMLRGADLILHPTVANDRRDVCPVRCKENALPMVISVFQDSSYALDAGGAVVADLAGRGGALICDLYPYAAERASKYGLRFTQRQMTRGRRRPATYAAVTDPAAVPPWTEVFEHADGTPVSAEELRRRFPGLGL